MSKLFLADDCDLYLLFHSESLDTRLVCTNMLCRFHVNEVLFHDDLVVFFERGRDVLGTYSLVETPLPVRLCIDSEADAGDRAEVLLEEVALDLSSYADLVLGALDVLYDLVRGYKSELLRQEEVTDVSVGKVLDLVLFAYLGNVFEQYYFHVFILYQSAQK